MSDCLFCKFASGEFPCHKVWEDEKHLAFLTIFPNTDGVTVVIPKQHYSSYAFDLPSDVFHDLVDAARAVAKKIDAAFDDVGRTGMVFE
jgi:diadenosine tetraphosphate (Ap4A) HIT family hydrolase